MTETLPLAEISAPAKHSLQWGRILAWGGLILLMATVAFGLLRAQQGQMGIHQKAPNFSLTTFGGQKFSLDELKGKVVVVNFWASWCLTCKDEAADLEAAWRFYQPRGDVVFLGVDWTDTESAAKEYMESFDITYPNGPDLGTRISQFYRITGVPETYVIDKNGILAYVKFSPFSSLAEIKAAIDPLLDQ